MATVQVHGESASLEDPVLVEGFPGLGLVGKIATDHLIDALEMRHYASIHCEGLPLVGVYRSGSSAVRPPVRVYLSESDDLLALQSDVPVSTGAVHNVAECLTAWIEAEDLLPLYLSGYPADADQRPEMRGVATGDGASILETHGIEAPGEDGVVSGPTGALLGTAAERDLDAVGLIVESHPQFPDPTAASVLLEDGIGPIAAVDVSVTTLLEGAEEIRQQREQLIQQLQEAQDAESSQARPLRMYQ